MAPIGLYLHGVAIAELVTVKNYLHTSDIKREHDSGLLGKLSLASAA